MHPTAYSFRSCFVSAFQTDFPVLPHTCARETTAFGGNRRIFWRDLAFSNRFVAGAVFRRVSLGDAGHQSTRLFADRHFGRAGRKTRDFDARNSRFSRYGSFGRIHHFFGVWPRNFRAFALWKDGFSVVICRFERDGRNFDGGAGLADSFDKAGLTPSSNRYKRVAAIGRGTPDPLKNPLFRFCGRESRNPNGIRRGRFCSGRACPGRTTPCPDRAVSHRD